MPWSFVPVGEFGPGGRGDFLGDSAGAAAPGPRPRPAVCIASLRASVGSTNGTSLGAMCYFQMTYDSYFTAAPIIIIIRESLHLAKTRGFRLYKCFLSCANFDLKTLIFD